MNDSWSFGGCRGYGSRPNTHKVMWLDEYQEAMVVKLGTARFRMIDAYAIEG